jgi:ATP-dependent helicase Lhr and Lhr-like helicase
MKGLAPQQIKERIPHTWPLFFARHGRFTPVQQQAIPPILDGNQVLVVAPTASGKTEAVLSPLLERHWSLLGQPGLGLLYICPTRALVRDLYERLRPILEDTGITLGMKTGDVRPGSVFPAILLTTPESTDSLLTRSPKLFIDLKAIVVDEIHLFDNTPRGDHLRCLLPRVERIRQYAQAGIEPAQRVVLSATVPDPAGVAKRYLQAGVVVQVPGGRPIVADVTPLYNLGELVKALTGRPARKSLVFCNSRAEVEATAASLRQHLPYQAEIFVHYSNLDTAMRRETEERFAQAAVAICVCTSTLELGIDIGTIDDVVLLGAPYDVNAYSQRIGRGGRRAGESRVLCMPKSPGEWARFEALLTLANSARTTEPPAPRFLGPATEYGFRPSVLVQQIFSVIKQSPTGSVRPADIRRIAPQEVTSQEIRKIISHLAFAGYLQPGRPGEWKPADKLNVLLDQHEIYSNIGGDVGGIAVIDAHSGRTIAYTDQPHPVGTILLFGGRTMQVAWLERYRFGLVEAAGKEPDDILRFGSAYAAVPLEVTQAVAHSLGLETGEIAALPQVSGLFLFHFWGTVWGELLADVLVAQGIGAEAGNEYYLVVNRPIDQLPPCDETAIHKCARKLAATAANRLEMGRFHRLLPADVAVAATLRQINPAQFDRLYRLARIVNRPVLYDRLDLLI